MIFLPLQEFFFSPYIFFRPNIIKLCIKFDSKLSCRLRLLFYLIIFQLDINFDKSAIRLHFLLISSMLTKFQENQRSIVMSSIKCLNFEFFFLWVNEGDRTPKLQVYNDTRCHQATRPNGFCNLKLYIKDKFMDQIVNKILLI